MEEVKKICKYLIEHPFKFSRNIELSILLSMSLFQIIQFISVFVNFPPKKKNRIHLHKFAFSFSPHLLEQGNSLIKIFPTASSLRSCLYCEIF